jgi:hypothetical protein
MGSGESVLGSRLMWIDRSNSCMTGQLGNQRPKEEKREISVSPRNLPLWMSLALCVHRQAAVVRMFLRFLGLCILPFEVGERHIKRLVTET